MTDTTREVPAHVRAALEDIVAAGKLTMDGDDLILESAIGWSFDDMQSVAEALGICDIDIGDKVDLRDSGCETCGHGAILRVYGVGKEASK